MVVQAFHQKKHTFDKLLLIEAINQNPDTIDNYFYLGRAFFATNETQDAIKYLKEYIERTKDHPTAIINRANACNLLGQCYEVDAENDSAKFYYKLATTLHPMSASGWHNMGLIYSASAQQYIENNLEKTLDRFNQYNLLLTLALSYTKDCPVFLTGIIHCFEKYTEAIQTQTMEAQQHIDNAFKSAIQYFYQALNSCIDDEAFRNIVKLNLTECPAQYGHYLYKKHDYSSAQKYYSQTIRFDPDHLIAINQLGMCFLKKNLLIEARGYFADIIGRTNDNQTKADAWFNIAITFRLQNNWRKAANALRTAKLLAPNDSHILEEEQRLREIVSMSFFASSNIKTLFHQHHDAETKSTPNATPEFR